MALTKEYKKDEKNPLLNYKIELGAKQELLLVLPGALATTVAERSEAGRRRAEPI